MNAIGAITTIDALKRWFVANGKPWFTLKYDTGSTGDRIIMRNDAVDDMGRAWEILESHVADQADSGRARLILFVYDKGKHNNATYTNIDIRPGYASPQQGAAHAIAGLPAGIGSVQEYVDMRVNMAKMQMEMDQLREQAAAPMNTFERVAETLSGIPGVADMLKMFTAGIVTKFNPAAAPQIQRILNGTPDAMAEAGDDDEQAAGATDPQTVFSNNINQVSQTLDVDPLTLSNKLAKLVSENPEVARQLLNS